MTICLEAVAYCVVRVLERARTRETIKGKEMYLDMFPDAYSASDKAIQALTGKGV